MCEPLTVGMGLTLAGMIAAAGSATVGAVSAVEQQKAQAEQADFESDVAARNAELAEKQSWKEEYMARQEKDALHRKMLFQMGDVKTGMAASGVRIGTGSPLMIEKDVLQAYSADYENLGYDIENRVWRTKMAGYNFKNQSRMSDFAARSIRNDLWMTKVGGAMNVGGSLLQGAASGAQLAELGGKQGWWNPDETVGDMGRRKGWWS